MMLIKSTCIQRNENGKVLKIACQAEILPKSCIEDESSFGARLFFLQRRWYKMQKKWSG